MTNIHLFSDEQTINDYIGKTIEYKGREYTFRSFESNLSLGGTVNNLILVINKNKSPLEVFLLSQLTEHRIAKVVEINQSNFGESELLEVCYNLLFANKEIEPEEIKECQEEIKEYQEEIKEYQEEIKEYQEEIQKLMDEKRLIFKKNKRRVEQIDSEITLKNIKISKVERKISEAERKISEAEEKISEVERKISEVERKEKNKQRERLRIEELKKLLGTENNFNKSVINELEFELAVLKKKHEMLEQNTIQIKSPIFRW